MEPSNIYQIFSATNWFFIKSFQSVWLKSIKRHLMWSGKHNSWAHGQDSGYEITGGTASHKGHEDLHFKGHIPC